MRKCWICGRKATAHRNIGTADFCMMPFDERVQRCYCESCYNDVTEQYKRDMSEYLRLKKKLMFERAVRKLERQDLELYDYQEAIQAVEEFATEHPDKFDSAYEMMAAIILVDNEIACELQRKIGPYQCDFYIPSMKVILEIDGDRHKHRKEFDSKRDKAIKQELGPGWNVVRIKTDYLDQKADLLVEAIKSVIEERRKKTI